MNDPWYFKGLNPEQIQAVSHDYGPLLILAGAGSGKTTVLVARCGRLIHEKICNPEELLVLTFTNKAARELKHRVQEKLSLTKTRGQKKIWAGTFHAWGLQLLKKHGSKIGLPSPFEVLDQSDSQAVIKDLLRELRLPGFEKMGADRILKVIHEWRQNPKATVIADSDVLSVAEILKPRYEKKLELLGATDFEGLLIKPLEILRKFPEVLKEVQTSCKQIMVDEFQDTNLLQMELIELLAAPYNHLTVVGDDDQSIYGWRGAEIKNILQFPTRFHGQNREKCAVIKLERNYRSIPSIVTLANAVIAKNPHRHGKVLRANPSEHVHLPESFVCESEEQECEFVTDQIRHFNSLGYAKKDIAILFRSNSQGSLLEGALRRHQIPYKITGSQTLLDRKEVKDVLAYLRACVNFSEFSMKRILNVPLRGLGDAVLETLNSRAAGFANSDPLKFYKALRAAPELEMQAQQRESIQALLDFFQRMHAELIDTKSSETMGQALLRLMREVGYRDYLMKLQSETRARVTSSGTAADPGDKKWVLVEILARILDAFVKTSGRNLGTLEEFLGAMDLRDVESEDSKVDEVQLLTIHASKGLEFPVVIIIGIEEDMIPHKILGTDAAEERRLFYVALTRAKIHLLLSRCESRWRFGHLQKVSPSRFLVEIPKDLLVSHESVHRPVSGESRTTLVADFMAKLQAKKAGSTAKPKN